MARGLLFLALIGCGSVQGTTPDGGSTPDAAIDASIEPADAGTPDADLTPDAGPTFTIERVSVDSAGAEANQATFNVAISDDGRYVTFTSSATNLVASDTNANEDAFRFDRMTRQTLMVGVTPGGVQGNGTNYGDPNNISANGRFVTIDFNGNNLVTNTAGQYTVILHDFMGNTNTRVGIKVDGANFGESSYSYPNADGTVVVFNAESHAWVRTLSGTPATTPADLADNDATANDQGGAFAVSNSGQYVLFWSQATNLVANDFNAKQDLFVRDRTANSTVRVSLADNDAELATDTGSGSLSADGGFIAFLSDATNVVVNDTNAKRDVFVRDRVGGTTSRVHISSSGAQANGDACAFPVPQLSGDGRFVVFCSEATNLVPDDTNGVADVFVHDRVSRKTVRVTTSADGVEANGATTGQIDISADGRWVAFSSVASNLVAGDNNGQRDAFVARNVLAP